MQEKMDVPRFPLYRRSLNGLNWYRIESATEFTEVQKVGSRYVVHSIQATAYPEMLRIMVLITLEDGHVLECPPEEVERLLTETD